MNSSTSLDSLLTWLTSVLGPIEVLADSSKAHGDHASSTLRIHTRLGVCYLKAHQSAAHWHNEVHAYEEWAHAFGDLTPQLVAVRDTPPLALVINELPGHILERTWLDFSNEQGVWRAAGAALVALHDLGSGDAFGRCWRDGTTAETVPQEAQDYIAQRFAVLMECALDAGYLNQSERSILDAAQDLIPAFEGESPLPCHRDYCAANWLVSEDGALAGVIDFEFAQWDVRVADFSRDPNWSWIYRPDLVAAFFEGYGWSPTPTEAQQLLAARAMYALGAIVWGHDHAFYGFEREGREALTHLASRLT